MAVVQRLCAILCLFFVTKVASEELHYYHQVDQIRQDTFIGHNVKSITFLDFRGCKVDYISRTAFAQMTSLKTLVLTYNNMQYLSEYLFKDTENLDYIELKSNQIKHIPKKLLLNLHKLTLLNLDNNLISSIEEGTFDGNTKLKTLHLKNNRLTVIPIGVFNVLKELEHLDLSDNLIYKIEESALPVSQSLKTLLLYSNKLSTLDEKYLKTVTHATIDRNPFLCDCHLKEVYAKWKANHVNQGWSPVCDAPRKLHNVKWTALQPDNFICEKINLNVYSKDHEITSQIGSSVSLNCLVTGDVKVSDVSWTYQNKTVVDLLQDVGRSFSVKFNSGNDMWYNLTINDVRCSDDGIYKCVVKDENDVYEIEKRVLVEDCSLKGIKEE